MNPERAVVSDSCLPNILLSKSTVIYFMCRIGQAGILTGQDKLNLDQADRQTDLTLPLFTL